MQSIHPELPSSKIRISTEHRDISRGDELAVLLEFRAGKKLIGQLGASDRRSVKLANPELRAEGIGRAPEQIEILLIYEGCASRMGLGDTAIVSSPLALGEHPPDTVALFTTLAAAWIDTAA